MCLVYYEIVRTTVPVSYRKMIKLEETSSDLASKKYLA